MKLNTKFFFGIIVIVSCFIIGIFIYIYARNDNSGEIVTNYTTSLREALTYIKGPSESTLILPGEGVSLTVPNAFYTVTQDDIDKYKPNVQSYWYDCGLFYKDAINNTGFYISFTPLGPCASEKMYSVVNDQIFYGNMSNLCDRLQKQQMYAGCGVIENPPAGYKEVQFYEYIPAYGYNGVGTIVKTYYLERIDGMRILFSLIPDVINQNDIKEVELPTIFDSILGGSSQVWHNVQGQVEIMNSIVQSIR